MQINVNASTARAIMVAAGRTLDDLKTMGRFDLNNRAYLVASYNPGALRRCFTFTLGEVSHAGGKHLADFVTSADRELLPACHADHEGTFEQRRTSQNQDTDERVLQSRARAKFLAM